MYVCVCVSIYIYIYAHAHTNIYIYVYMYMHACIHIYMYVCALVCACVRIHVCGCTCMPSTPRQKLKMLIKGHVITAERDDLCATVTNKGLVLEIDHTYDDVELCNFETVVVLGKDQAPFGFDPYSNLNVNTIHEKFGYFPGKGTGERHLPLNSKENLCWDTNPLQRR